jgi:beta-lactamase regulating signal transducer with metallopeptidase domain
MGYSSGKYRKLPEARRWRVHPAWNGIGCVLMILIPIMAWAGAAVFIESNTLFSLPENLTSPIQFQKTETGWVNQVILWLNANLGGRGLTYAQLILWVAFILIGLAVIAILYGLMYRMVGPPRYSPLDSPPIKKGKRR